MRPRSRASKAGSSRAMLLTSLSRQAWSIAPHAGPRQVSQDRSWPRLSAHHPRSPHPDRPKPNWPSCAIRSRRIPIMWAAVSSKKRARCMTASSPNARSTARRNLEEAKKLIDDGIPVVPCPSCPARKPTEPHDHDLDHRRQPRHRPGPVRPLRRTGATEVRHHRAAMQVQMRAAGCDRPRIACRPWPQVWVDTAIDLAGLQCRGLSGQGAIAGRRLSGGYVGR